MQDRTLFLSVYAILYTKGLLSGGGGRAGQKCKDLCGDVRSFRSSLHRNFGSHLALGLRLAMRHMVLDPICLIANLPCHLPHRLYSYRLFPLVCWRRFKFWLQSQLHHNHKVSCQVQNLFVMWFIDTAESPRRNEIWHKVFVSLIWYYRFI